MDIGEHFFGHSLPLCYKWDDEKHEYMEQDDQAYIVDKFGNHKLS